jgi:tetratricopeptide (TPR) repeat protein
VPGTADEPRFVLLETIRDYAHERLDECGERETIERRHFDYFLRRAEEIAELMIAGKADESAFDSLEADHENLRTALAWAARRNETELEVRLVTALRQFWIIRGHLAEARRFFEHAISASERGDPAARALALVNGAAVVSRQGDFAAAAVWWEESLALYRALGDVDGIARSVAELGSVAISEGDLNRAEALYEEGATLFEQRGNRVRLGVALANLAAIADMRGDRELAAIRGAEAIALQRELEDRSTTSAARSSISVESTRGAEHSPRASRRGTASAIGR